MKTIDSCRLYTFVDTACLQGRSPTDVARALCDGGSDVVQLRAKGSGFDDVRRMAESILPITREAHVPLVINDFPKVAREIGAEFVHLGQEDFFDAGFTYCSELKKSREEREGGGARNRGSSGSRSSRDLLVGLSSHAPNQAARAISAGADYIAVGPVFATATKPGREPVTLDYVRWAAANVTVPWFAIGGITLKNLDDVLAAGARRVCVVSAILNAPDIARACLEWKQRLTSAPL
jgi:thiamine-phosphate pyrophosphorylase